MTLKYLNALISLSIMVAIFAGHQGNSTLFWLMKPATTILIICLPVIFGKTAGSDFVVHRHTIIFALIACLAGDVFLLSDDYFAFGIGAFLIAHLLFAYVFFKLSSDKPFLLALFFLAAPSAFFYSVLYPTLGELQLPVAIYNCCIVLMCWQGIRVWLSRRDTQGLTLAGAALLFIFSDSVIAINKFLIPFDFAHLVILSAYWASITLIANTFSGERKSNNRS